MQDWLQAHGIKARVKYMAAGSLKGTWRLYDGATLWDDALASRLNGLGFVSYDNKPLSTYSGNGGRFSVFVRGHSELL